MTKILILCHGNLWARNSMPVYAALYHLLQRVWPIHTTSVLLLKETTFCLEYDINSTAADQLVGGFFVSLNRNDGCCPAGKMAEIFLVDIKNRIKCAKRPIPIKRLTLVETVENLQSFICYLLGCIDFAPHDHDVVTSNQRIHLLSTLAYHIPVFDLESSLAGSVA